MDVLIGVAVMLGILLIYCAIYAIKDNKRVQEEKREQNWKDYENELVHTMLQKEEFYATHFKENYGTEPGSLYCQWVNACDEYRSASSNRNRAGSDIISNTYLSMKKPISPSTAATAGTVLGGPGIGYASSLKAAEQQEKYKENQERVAKSEPVRQAAVESFQSYTDMMDHCWREMQTIVRQDTMTRNDWAKTEQEIKPIMNYKMKRND